MINVWGSSSISAVSFTEQPFLYFLITISMTFEAAPSSFPSSLPTDLNEQQQIVDYLDRKCGAIDRVLAVKKQQLEKLEIHERSMIYDYVTGVKRVKGAI